MRLFLLSGLLAASLFAETYEEYLKAQQQAFSAYKEERDKAFSDFLNKEWKAYKEAQGYKAYEEKKPLALPKAPPKQKQTPPKRVTKVEEPKKIPRPPHPPKKEIKPVPEPKKEVKNLVIKPKEVVPPPVVVPKESTPKVVAVPPVVKEKERPKQYTKIVIPPENQRLKSLYLKFFGVDVQVHYDPSILFSVSSRIDKSDIADSWDHLAQSDYEATIKELNTISDTLQLNDWARYLLIKKVASGIYHKENEAKIFSWFALLKMGYDAHVAYQSQRVVLLLPIEGDLYNTIYYTLNNKKYYAIDYYAKGKIGSIMTYDNTYEGANAGIDFAVTELPRFADVKAQKRLLFQMDNKPREVQLSYNTNLMNFFQTYPQVAYTNYFSSPESILLQESIKTSFTPLLEGKSQEESIDIILNFVQNAFKYQVDNKQFNQEKVMFPSETLFYPYSDCEDRAILFTYMVKTLLGIDIVGVKYPNHMATAVKVDEQLKGEYVYAGKRSYLVADPTYINASVGMSMPQFIGTKSYEIVSTGAEK